MPSQKGNNFFSLHPTHQQIYLSIFFFSYHSLSISLLVLLEYTASNREGVAAGGRLKRLVPRVGCSERSGHMEMGVDVDGSRPFLLFYSGSLSLSLFYHPPLVPLHYFLFCCCCCIVIVLSTRTYFLSTSTDA